MGPAALVETAYVSFAAVPLSLAELEAIVRTSRRRNQAVNVTGLLLHAGGAFLQVLEGPHASVDHLYERIAIDPRHQSVIRIFKREIVVRSFPTWRMGFEQLSDTNEAELMELANAARKFGTGFPEDVRAHTLISHFTAGRWRATTSGRQLTVAGAHAHGAEEDATNVRAEDVADRRKARA